jgi:NADPH:quinone reductase-like Zn-dependent oxidoreductase
MRAFVLERYGRTRPLQCVNMPVPELRDDEVLVQVHAAGVNLLDAKIRSGEFNRSCLIACRSCWATTSPARS